MKVKVSALIASTLLIASTYGQVGIDRLVNVYSLMNQTWDTFTSTVVTGTLVRSVSGLTVGYGQVNATAIGGIVTTNVSLDFASCGTNATVVLTQAISGVDTNDVAVVNITNPHTSFVYNVSVTAADTVTIRASNISITNAINQAAIDARIVVFKY